MPKTVLLSAYACEPGKGSEPGIGWNWACQIANQGHEVTVLTQPRFLPAIAQACQTGTTAGMTAVAVRVPILDRWESVFSRLGTPYYYAHILLWQLAAYRVAWALHRRQSFDWVHQVTLGAARIPSLMGFLGIPFLLGPIAGGETAPWRLRKSFPLRGWVHALVRDLSNAWVRLDPLVRLTFRQATRIIATTEQTRAMLPRSLRAKSAVQLAIGIEQPASGPMPSRTGPFKLLYVGRLLYWKGLHFGLRALAELRREVPDARLTIVGSGPDEVWLRKLCERLGLQDAVDWIGWMSREDLARVYSEHDAFLFPSLHDSGGMVVLEAFAQGLPVVCLDLGGPGLMVDESCGRVIPTRGASEREVVAALHAALRELAENPALRETLRHGALARVREYAWPVVVARAYALSFVPGSGASPVASGRGT
jgi:glycosyltransferase involved in cell wall biosynthesis